MYKLLIFVLARQISESCSLDDLVVGNRSFSINFSAKITTNRKDMYVT